MQLVDIVVSAWHDRELVMGAPDRPGEIEEADDKFGVNESGISSLVVDEGSANSGSVWKSDQAAESDGVEVSRPRKESVGRKTFDLVVPPPISTSTRSFGAARPVSMALGSPTSSPKKTATPSSGTPKKWVVNLPTPLAGFSSSPSPSSRLSQRLSMRFDTQMIQNSFLSQTAPPTPPMTDEESSSSKSSIASPDSASPEPSFLKSVSISIETSDDEPLRASKSYDQRLDEENSDDSRNFHQSTSSYSLTSDNGTEGTLTLDALVSPRYRPPVPLKSAALLERQREKAALQSSPRSAAKHDHASSHLSPTRHNRPPVPTKRKSAHFDTSTIKLNSSSGSAPHDPADLPLSPEERAKRRSYLAAEILKTERFYVKSLKTIVNSYLQPMRASLTAEVPILSADSQKALFSNVEVLLNIHLPFLSELETTMAEWNSNSSKIGRSLISLTPYLKIYTQYINNYNKSMHTYQDAMKHKTFRRFMAEAAVGNDLDNWPSYCIQPVQRIPKYLIILSELLKNTTEDHPDYLDLKTAFDALTATATEINTHKRDAENLTQCANIQSIVAYSEGVKKVQIVTQTRRYCREGQFDVFINGIATTYNYLVLFNDSLLITKSKRKHLRFDGFLTLANTCMEAFDVDDLHVRYSQPPSASSSNHLDIPGADDSSLHHRSLSGPVTVPPHASASFSLTLKSLVINATIVIIFQTFEDFQAWKSDIALASAKHEDIVTPDTFPDIIVSLDAMQAASDEIHSHTRKRSLSLGASRGKRLKRLLTLGTGKSKRDLNTHSSIDTAAPDS